MDRMKYFLEAGKYIEFTKVPNRGDYARYYKIVAREWIGDIPVQLITLGGDGDFAPLAAGAAQAGFFQLRHLEPSVGDRLFQLRYMMEFFNTDAEGANPNINLDMLKNVRMFKQNPPGIPLHGTDKQNDIVDANGNNVGGKTAGALTWFSNPYHIGIDVNDLDANLPAFNNVYPDGGYGGSSQFPFEANEDFFLNGYWPLFNVDNQSAIEVTEFILHTVGMKYELRRLDTKEKEGIKKGYIRPKTVQIGGTEITTASRR